MIAVVTNRDDVTADWLVLELRRQALDFVRINTEDYVGSLRLTWRPEGATLTSPTLEIKAEDISSVWWRRPAIDAGREGRSAAEIRWALAEAATAFEGFWAHVSGVWVNHPADNQRADCKPEQLLRARALGLAVPPTVITDDPDQVRAFAFEHGLIVTKALKDGRLPSGDGSHRAFTTTEIEADALESHGFGPEPALFQAHLRKRSDIRVTVVGDDVFACRISSQVDPAARVDWRAGDVASLPHSSFKLPDRVAELCLELVASYRLRFAAIDLVETVDGDLVFLELNPNGQWAWVEHRTGLPIARRLARELGAVTQ